MDASEYLKRQTEYKAKQTIGYSEAKDRQSFLVGVSVAFDICKDFFEPKIFDAEQRGLIHKTVCDQYLRELKAISKAFDIVQKYQDHD